MRTSKNKPSTEVSDSHRIYETYDVNSAHFKLGDHLKCPICGTVFEYADDTKYIAKKAYTCSWKCFLSNIKTNLNCEKSSVNEKSNNKRKSKKMVLQFKGLTPTTKVDIQKKDLESVIKRRKN